MDKNGIANSPKEDHKESPKRRIERWEISWYVLLILGPTVYIAPFVALFCVLYSVGLGWLFLVLAILGLVLYPISVVLLLRMWKKAGDPYEKPHHISAIDEDFSLAPKWNAGIVGLALYHGLFGGRHKSNSNTEFRDLFWQEKYRNHDY